MTRVAHAPPPHEVTVDDDALVARVRLGDTAAFTQLVERHQRRLFQLALGIVRGREEALDVVQEAFIRIHRALPGFKGESAFSTWAWRITRNLALDELRRRKGQTDELDERTLTDAEEEPLSDYGHAGSVSPQKAALRGELSRHMHEALATLSEAHRTILLLREVDGLSYEELAVHLEIPIGTVMSRLFHARKRMQSALRPYLEEEP